MLRFIAYAVPLLILLLALFGFTVELLDAEPRSGSVIRLALFEQPRVPGQLVLGTWLVEASGLIALFLLAQGRFGAWWLDGLVAGWVAWVFRGPLLVITIVVAARQPQDPWWKLAFGWWVLYSVCGLSLAILARRSGLASWTSDAEESQVVAVAAQTVPDRVNNEPVAKDESSARDVEEAPDESSAGEVSPDEVTPDDAGDVEAEEPEAPSVSEPEAPEPAAEAVADEQSEASETVQVPEPEADPDTEPVVETQETEDSSVAEAVRTGRDADRG